jgi:hypothetical protein
LAGSPIPAISIGALIRNSPQICRQARTLKRIIATTPAIQMAIMADCTGQSFSPVITTCGNNDTGEVRPRFDGGAPSHRTFSRSLCGAASQTDIAQQLNGLLAVERDREQRWLNLFSDYELPCESFEQAEKTWNSLPRREREVTERARRETLEEAARVVHEWNDSIKNGNEISHPKHMRAAHGVAASNIRPLAASPSVSREDQ